MGTMRIDEKIRGNLKQNTLNDECVIYLKDDSMCSIAGQQRKTLPVHMTHCGSTVYLTVSSKMEAGGDFDEEDAFTVALEFYDGRIVGRIWQPQDQGGDPTVEQELLEEMPEEERFALLFGESP